MIDEEKTLKRFGYLSTDLSHGSDKPVIVICDWCGIEFARSKRASGGNRFCSRNCKNKYNSECVEHIKKICEYCGNEYTVVQSRSDRSRFCSRVCYGLWRSENVVGDKSPVWKGGDITRKCNFCGIEYTTPRKGEHITKFCSYACANKHNSLCNNVVNVCKQCGKEYNIVKARQEISSFCSTVCKAEWQSENSTGENSPSWKGGQVLKVCEWCKNEYYIDPSKSEMSRFCSRYCKDAWFSGENHPSWQGGISFAPYCKKFNDVFKESVRDKFGRTCFVCGKDEDRNGQNLDIHHVAYLKDCLCGEVNCDFVPLCKVCHGKTNANRPFWECLFTYALQYRDAYYEVEIPKGLLRTDYINK